MAENPERTLNRVFKSRVISDVAGLTEVYAIRAICFVEERKIPFHKEFDDNDAHATHFVTYVDEEPAGTSRVRWFSGFAKVEKTAIRPAFRDMSTLRFHLDFVFSHVARKGYSTLITTAEETYARLWERRFGFQRVPGRSSFKTGGETEFYEMVKYLDVPADAITLQTPQHVLFRSEGKWEEPGPAFG